MSKPLLYKSDLFASSPTWLLLTHISCLFKLSRLWSCEAGPQDQITKWSGEDTFLFSFYNLKSFSAQSISPCNPPPITALNWPVTWSLKVSRFWRAVLMQSCLAEHELCRRETRRACNYFVACLSLCLPLPNRCSVFMLLPSVPDCSRSNVDGKIGVGADKLFIHKITAAIISHSSFLSVHITVRMFFFRSFVLIIHTAWIFMFLTIICCLCCHITLNSFFWFSHFFGECLWI